jgi:hypothetical protein
MISKTTCKHNNKAGSIQPLPKKSAQNTDLFVTCPSAVIQRMTIEPESISPGDILQLQRTIGNQVVMQMLKPASPKKGTSAPVPEHLANNTGLPGRLKEGIENLSGISMDDVKTHYNSPKPSQLKAFAYTQGTDIFVGPGQEKHLAHEAWHVAQQKMGRVRPTVTTLEGHRINDDPGLENEADQMGEKIAQGKFLGGIPAFNDGTALTPVNQCKIIQRDPWDQPQSQREQNLAAGQNARVEAGAAIPGAHPVAIGARYNPANPGQTFGQERHLDDDMLETLQAVLNALPPSHINGNPRLGRIVMEHAVNGAASFYQGGQITIIVPFDASSWLYLNLTKWPLGDFITTLLTSEHPSGALARDVVGTGEMTNKLSMIPEKFVKWMLRHETGHSVDDAIDWSENRHYREAGCGAWEVFGGAGNPTEAQMVNTILNAVGINGPVLANLNAAFQPSTGAGYNSIINAVTNRNTNHLNPAYRQTALNIFETTNPGGTRLVDYAEKVIRVGLSSPYEKGGGIRLNNRTYHRDPQHDDWISYNSASYDLRDSNYQFQNPSEWFAETYARYFIPPAAQWGNNVRNPLSQAWFLANLDPVNNPAPALIAGGNLVPTPPTLLGVAPQAPAVVPTRTDDALDTLKNVSATIVKLPLDLVTRAAGMVTAVGQGGIIAGQGLFRAIKSLIP